MKLRALGLGIVLSCVGVSANAAIDAGNGGGSFAGPTNPELFLWVGDFNGITGETLVVDLGIDTSYDFNNDFTFSGVDLGFFTAPQADLNWGLITATGTATNAQFWYTGTASDLNGFEFTVGTSTGLSVIGRVDSFVREAEHNVGSLADDLQTTASGAPSGATIPGFNLSGDLIDGSNRIETGTAIGESLDFFTTQINADFTGFDTSQLGLGQVWTLNAGGELTWQGGGTPIPLPAGIWLLGSALLGLVGVSRRKAA